MMSRHRAFELYDRLILAFRSGKQDLHLVIAHFQHLAG